MEGEEVQAGADKAYSACPFGVRGSRVEGLGDRWEGKYWSWRTKDQPQWLVRTPILGVRALSETFLCLNTLIMLGMIKSQCSRL